MLQNPMQDLGGGVSSVSMVKKVAQETWCIVRKMVLCGGYGGDTTLRKH